MNFKNILLLISIISLIFVCVGGVAAHPGHGHEYIEEVSSSSDSPQSAPSHSGSYQQSHSSGGSLASHNYQSKSSQKKHIVLLVGNLQDLVLIHRMMCLILEI